MPRVEALVPAGAGTAELEGEQLRTWLADRYALRGDRWVRLNLVTALGGQLAGPGGTSDDLTGGIDRTVLGVIRRSGDVVLVGSGSVRVERPAMPRTAQLAIASVRGDLEAAQLPEAVDGRVPIVLCGRSAADALRDRLGSAATVVAVDGDPSAAPGVLIDALARLGLRRVVCEGGAALAAGLLAAGVVDEFDQTIAPLGVVDGPVLRAPIRAASLGGLLRDGTDRLYARWLLRPR